MGLAQEQGRDLEQRIAAHFEANGYSVRCNAVLEGRSGGRHEIDVLAEKSDALTSFRVAVECKAWQEPIEKEVVSKLDYIVRDLSLNKGIIVSLSGGRSGADRAAADLGIDLWGPDELRRHLGESAVGAMGAGAAVTSNVTWGYAFGATPTQAQAALAAVARGRFLRRGEQVVWMSPVWLPVFCVHLAASQPVTKRLKTRVRSTSVTNLYDGLSGTHLGPLRRPFEPVAAESSLALPPLVRDTKVHASLKKALDGYQRVTTEAARQRHASLVESLGIPMPCTSVSIDHTELVRFPYYVGVLADGPQQRAVALSGESAVVSNQISDLLTTHLSHLRAHFGPAIDGLGQSLGQPARMTKVPTV